jgi:hypothetical protein
MKNCLLILVLCAGAIAVVAQAAAGTNPVVSAQKEEVAAQWSKLERTVLERHVAMKMLTRLGYTVHTWQTGADWHFAVWKDGEIVYQDADDKGLKTRP